MKKLNLFQILITIIAVVLTSVVIAYGWTAPLGGPPKNDVPPPINVGSIGQIKEGGLSVANKPTVSNVGFRVITGNLVFGSSTAAVSKGGIFDGFINAKDVWIRDANSGAGAWASQVVSGGGNTVAMGVVSNGQWVKVPPGFTTAQCKITLIPKADYWRLNDGYTSMNDTGGGTCQNGVIRNFVSTSTTDAFRVRVSYQDSCIGENPMQDYYILNCDASGGSGGSSVFVCQPPGATSTGTYGACNVPPPPDCSGPPYYGCSTFVLVPGTQTAPLYTCQNDGTWLQTGTKSLPCWGWGTQCLDASYCAGGG